jgi:uncharacterized protein (DUF2132 family)
MASPDPLHGKTLETILKELVENIGWEEMAYRVPIRCFTHDPSVSSSLKFLRRTPWAREKFEDLYRRGGFRKRREST